MKTKSTPTTGSKFDLEPHFLEVNGYQIHYVDEGSGDPILFLHGNPTSSYTYRNVLKEIAAKTNRRVIALDLLGFGKSEKPNIKHNCLLHARIISGFISKLKLNRIILVGEDWGGFLGGFVMTKLNHLFESAILMETFLWPFTYEEDYAREFVMPFKLMRSPIGFVFSKVLNVMINKMIPEHCPISEESLQYYKDSVPSYRDKKAIGDFPKMIPNNGIPKASHDFALELQDGLKDIKFPVLWIKATPGTIVSENNPIGLGRLDHLKTQIKNLTIQDFGPGFHFLSEENPERVIEMVSDWVNEIAIQKHAINELIL